MATSHSHATGSARWLYPTFALTLLLATVIGGGATRTAEAAAVAVTPTTLASTGWAMQHSTCGQGAPTSSQTFVTGPGTPINGNGSLQFNIGADGNSFEQLRLNTLNGVRLTDLTALSYSTYITQFGSGGQAPYLNLLIDLDNNGTVDDQLFFEPAYQTGTYAGASVPNQGNLVTGAWQTWNALVGGWWSLNAQTFGPPLVTLQSYAAQNPNARIVNTSSGGGLRILAGCGAPAWNNFIGSVDNVTVGVGNAEPTTYNFEPDSATATTTATATATVTSTATSTATATATSTATASPTPTATKTATATATMTATRTATTTMTATATRTPQAAERKVGVCHRTGSANNPWQYIEVSENATEAHRDHGDIIGVSSQADCPSTTPVPAACNNRGNVNLATTPEGQGRLRVTLTASNTPGLPPNQITEIEFRPTRNALIDINGQTGRTGEFTVTLPPGTQTISFLVQRQNAGQATTVHLNVRDQCGEWRTMIGGGPNAF